MRRAYRGYVQAAARRGMGQVRTALRVAPGGPASGRGPVNLRQAHRLSVAPMMDWTDRHCRFFHRLLTRRALLYTEMITTGAILHGDRERVLAYSPEEHPIALQIGGEHARELADCTQIAEALGYDEVNLNVGCPSDRVQEGRFGACLMRHPEVVADGIAAMRDRVKIPVTVKHRMGVDELDRYEDVARFVEAVAATGCEVFIVHARKAWLQGLSPKQNREVPPLRYADVYRLKRDFPHLRVEINGGITTLDEALDHLDHVDGVMLGRSAYHDPFLLAAVDTRVFGDLSTVPTRAEVVESLLPYLERHLAQGGRVHHVTRHLLGLFHGQPGARRWRRHLSEQAHHPGADTEVLGEALRQVAG